MRNTSSASYAALAEPPRARNGKLLVLCVTLGALSLGVVVLRDSIPKDDRRATASAETQVPLVARETATPAPRPTAPPRAKPVERLPERPVVKPVAKPREEPRAKPREPDTKDEPVETPAEQPAEKPSPVPSPEAMTPPVAAEPGEDLSPAVGAPSEQPPAPSSTTGVSDKPDVPSSVEAPLAGTPRPAAKPTARPAETPRPNERIERFDDGTIKARYQVDAKGQRSGPYAENHPNGKLAIKATYKAGLLDGTLTEVDPSGKIVRKAAYRNGQLHGELVTADATGKVATREVWFEGKLLYPKSVDAIERKLAEIAAEPLAGPAGAAKLPEFEPFAASSQIKALRRLRAYRYLCDVPYDVTLSRPYGELCTAAAQLLEILGHLDHHPDRPPGVADSLYVPACDGLANGNLHEHSNRRGEDLLMGGVDMWIFDSDRHNISQVGHRRTSLDPRMKEVAWGVRGKFAVMYSHDTGRDAHARDFVAYPSRGYFPISYLVKDSAWSCAFDSDRFRLADDAKVEVRPADDKLRKGEPVELRDVTVENKVGFAEGNAMIFKPDVTVSAGARYWVIVKGVTDLEGKPVSVEYLVEFIRG